jgi:hypothetical protein
MCQADPRLCYVDYDQYCLKGDPSLIATPVCKGYLSELIDITGSTPDIDPVISIPDEERQADITICACHLTAKDVPDPQRTVLYDRYFDNLVAKFPAFAAYGASIQKKC